MLGVTAMTQEEMTKLLPLYSAIKPVYTHGGLAVQMFWTISGFIFFYKYAQRIHDRDVRWFQFFIFRFSRLYPLHFVTLLAVAGLQAAAYYAMHKEYFVTGNNDITHFILNLFMASNWFTGIGYSFNSPIWSVSVE
jgi:peptidoglycan/LPS O-acetylase OafA/YrhL